MMESIKKIVREREREREREDFVFVRLFSRVRINQSINQSQHENATQQNKNIRKTKQNKR
jgi:hypothetical protein